MQECRNDTVSYDHHYYVTPYQYNMRPKNCSKFDVLISLVRQHFVLCCSRFCVCVSSIRQTIVSILEIGEAM